MYLQAPITNISSLVLVDENYFFRQTKLFRPRPFLILLYLRTTYIHTYICMYVCIKYNKTKQNIHYIRFSKKKKTRGTAVKASAASG